MAEAAIAGVVEHHQGYHAIRALPGIGPVLGAVIVAGIGGITRFPHPARLCSWAGLTPATVSFRSGTGMAAGRRLSGPGVAAVACRWADQRQPGGVDGCRAAA